MKNNKLSAGVSGEYTIKVIKKDGNSVFPFGELPMKNMILDTFFSKILNGYILGVQAFVQQCIVGDNNTAASRTDTGLIGSQVQSTWASSTFTANVISADNLIVLSRDFLFDTNTGASALTVREAAVGFFNPPYQTLPTIAVSRFVFPSDITINPGDRLIIYYTLKIKIDYLNTDVPLSLSGDGYNFSGNIRMSSAEVGIVSSVSNDTTRITYQAELANFYVYYRNFTSNNNSFSTMPNSQSYGNGDVPFGLKILPAGTTKTGFFPTTYTPTTYPTAKTDFTAQGPLGSDPILGNLQQSDTQSSIDATYYFAPHTSSRTVKGICLANNSKSSGAAVFLTFTSNQTIPAAVPITFKLRWTFYRL